MKRKFETIDKVIPCKKYKMVDTCDFCKAVVDCESLVHCLRCESQYCCSTLSTFKPCCLDEPTFWC